MVSYPSTLTRVLASGTLANTMLYPMTRVAHNWSSGMVEYTPSITMLSGTDHPLTSRVPTRSLGIYGELHTRCGISLMTVAYSTLIHVQLHAMW